ncbi:hypothetical protein IL38_19670 [Actinopolyspora erythraea]|uniref:Uncharacterized protein n=1 Tax=Actinopolyspora erythraea TaxID=414996 RepID=A0ABR4WZV7_9ACTN|nr:hypothetical protein [Actinopolyspora erythraea]KGI79937.1 hypothetical protein IL38_19670 [Actinopolyspora erythraea]
MEFQDREPSDGAAEELTRLVYDGSFETVHSEARDILRHPVFDHNSGERRAIGGFSSAPEEESTTRIQFDQWKHCEARDDT